MRSFSSKYFLKKIGLKTPGLRNKDAYVEQISDSDYNY